VPQPTADTLAERVRAQSFVFAAAAGAPPATMKDVQLRNDPEAVHWFQLGTKLASPAEVATKVDGERIAFPAIDEAERRVENLYATREALIAAAGGAEAAAGNVLQGQASVIDAAHHRVAEALARGFDTAAAIAAIDALAKAAGEVVQQVPKLKKNKAVWDAARALAARAVQAIDGSCALVGLMQATPEEFATRTRARRVKLRGLDFRAIEGKVYARVEARAAKDFPRADKLRAELDGLGVDVMDAGDTSTWRVRL
jgi:cysteinyl-tRNA synthetase